MSVVEIRVPDIGRLQERQRGRGAGQRGRPIAVDDPLITLETEKASMDVPSPVRGVIAVDRASRRATVSAGSLIADASSVAAAPRRARRTAAAGQAARRRRARAPPPARRGSGTGALPAATDAAGALDLVVLGAGPGGYTAAFRAADLGLKVTLSNAGPSSAECA